MSSSSLSIAALFLEGLLSFFSPCVLPLIPVLAGYLTAEETETDPKAARKHTAWMTLWFVLGICLVFVLAAAGAGILNTFFQSHSVQFSIAGGILLVLFGLTEFGVIQIPFLMKEHRLPSSRKKGSDALSAFLLGFFFSFAWSPCVGPLLASAIVMAADASSRALGYAYIAAYAAGFLLIFILLGLFTEEVLRFLKKKRNVVKYTQKIGGAILLAMGVYMLVQANQQISQVQTAAAEPTAEVSAEPGESAEAPSDTRTDAEKYNFTLEDAEGNAHSLTDYSGKTVVVNFFGTWCGYCNQELPHLQEIHDTREDVVILLIAAPGYNGEGNVSDVERYMKDAGYSMTILYDTDFSVSSRYGVQGYPYTFILKPDGSFLGYIPGYLPDESLDQAISEASGN